MKTDDLLRTCLGHLDELSFVRRVGHPLIEAKAIAGGRPPVVLDLELVDGTTRQAAVEIKRTNLTAPLLRAIRARLAQFPDYLPFTLAPYIPPGIWKLHTELGLNGVDACGNCCVNIDDRYIAMIHGHKPVRTPEDRGLRAPAYQVILALLIQAHPIRATMRQIANQAHVALGTVKNTLDHLKTTGAVVRVRDEYLILDREDLIERWLHGYETLVRPRWLAGRFKTQTADPDEIEQLVTATMAQETDMHWAWGGGTAAYALTKHYRGPETVLHVTRHVPQLARRLRALPDERGNLVLLRTPATFLNGVVAHTAHPLLIYAELRAKRDERADETAAMIKADFTDA